MRCFHPISIRLPEYDYRRIGSAGYLLVPCGKCLACRRRKQNEWAFRILQEQKSSVSSFFCTLTYDDDHLVFSEETGEQTLDKLAVPRFIRSFRKKFGQCRYFACGEYGDKFDRSHYHCLMFFDRVVGLDELQSMITECWHNGFATVDGEINTKSARYVAKYTTKQLLDVYEGRVAPFALMSRRPAIGSSFLSEKRISAYKSLMSLDCYDSAGNRFNLPRYYRDRIYSSLELKIIQSVSKKELDIITDRKLRDNPLYEFERSRSELNLIKRMRSGIFR